MKIEVGKEYLDENGTVLTVHRILGNGLVYSYISSAGELSGGWWPLSKAESGWKELKPEPKRHELKDMWVGWFKDSDGVFRGNPHSNKARAIALYAYPPLAITPATQDYCTEGEGLNDE